MSHMLTRPLSEQEGTISPLHTLICKGCLKTIICCFLRTIKITNNGKNVSKSYISTQLLFKLLVNNLLTVLTAVLFAKTVASSASYI